MSEATLLEHYGLSDLPRVPLPPHRERMLERAGEIALGSGPWRHCKLANLRDLFALERIAERFEVLAIDVTTELRALVRLHCPVPCRGADDADVRVAPGADLALCLREEILRGPLPGYAVVEVLAPRDVWHGNVASGPGQRLCLGANVPRGFPLREAVAASYGALTLQSVTLDERDPLGAMNADAVAYWQRNLERIPLTREPFLSPRPRARTTGDRP